MKVRNHLGFSLVELLIVISIMLLVLTFVYIPYAHYQEKIKIKQVIREVSQALSEARNMAINGYDEEDASGGGFQNKSIALYVSNEEDKKNNMYFYSYPYETIASAAAPEERSQENINLVKERKLPTGTQLDTVLSDKDGMFFFFTAISGTGAYFVYDAGTPQEFTGPKIDLNFSYKGSSSPVLQKSLIYDTRIHTIDF